MSNSVQPHRWQPTRLFCPWDSPGKNTGVGFHFLLQCMKVKSESEVAQSCLTHCHPMDCSLPGSSVHGIFQARVLEWVAISFSRSDGLGCLKLHSLNGHTGLRRCHYFPLDHMLRNFGGFPWWSSGKESACQWRGHRSDPWSRKVPHVQSHQVSETQLLSCALEPVSRNERSHHDEKPMPATKTQHHQK